MQKKLKQFLLYLLLCSAFFSHAQIQYEVNPPSYIRSIVFKSTNEGDQFPIIRQGERISLTFDDLTAAENDYYYKIIHCNYDWTPSKLLKQQYLRGLDNQRIIDYYNSYNTLQPFSHYTLNLPNNLTGFTITGNYMIEIYDNRDNLVFSRRFIIYKDLVNVGAVVKRSRDLSTINTHQRLEFVVNTGGANLVNPQQEVKVTLMQNYYWPGAINDIRPQFFSGNQLIYRYDREVAFVGGNEYIFFDTKDLRTASNGVYRVELEDLYHHYLFTDRDRTDLAYTYNPDVNGDFQVRNLDVQDVSTESDYTRVHFSFEYNNRIGLDKVYVFGKFNNYELGEENLLKFNDANKMLETDILLKQGFYNYKYVVVNEQGDINFHKLSGNHFQTENQYLIIVYYRDFGGMYDSIIGIGTANSATISN